MLTPIGTVCATEPLKLNVLEVPGKRVPELLFIVKSPPKLKVPAPPDMIICVCAGSLLLTLLNVKFPETVMVPVVIASFVILLFCVSD